ncbi:hypothetical protein FC50_GL000935 [Lacticaseibacillus pantheris DSM 15945 = JCM 12539 = NBRC 106106]|uniref:YopX protein domain-containing protein n=2 Tax=Lacticaseibacillus pantheris TaxID=171523 RepID=A0A0R1TZ87_9LACO|nr:hypothetical protein FC50_GL000935 [Lacticaseibacillus pantheris DSM 15945 = JCM 12539 = NBRC 106106]
MMIPDNFEFYDGKIGWIDASKEAGPGNDGCPDQFEIMQYTGLHDSNGKEIYEGDVLRDENGDLYRVKFDGGQFQPLLRYGGTQVAIESIADMADYSSVIGNIYENADLLEERNGRNL